MIELPYTSACSNALGEGNRKKCKHEDGNRTVPISQPMPDKRKIPGAGWQTVQVRPAYTAHFTDKRVTATGQPSKVARYSFPKGSEHKSIQTLSKAQFWRHH